MAFFLCFLMAIYSAKLVSSDTLRGNPGFLLTIRDELLMLLRELEASSVFVLFMVAGLKPESVLRIP